MPVAQVAEVIVRFGDSVVAVAHVAPGCGFDAPNGLRVVSPRGDGWVVPRGLGQHHAIDHARTRVELGSLSVEAAIVAAPPPLRSPRFELGWFAYVLASTALHIYVVILAAAAFPHSEHPSVTIDGVERAARPLHVARYESSAQTVRRGSDAPPPQPVLTPPPPAPSIEQPRVARTPNPTRRPPRTPPPRQPPPPSNYDPELDSYRSGPYTTSSTGRAIGDSYDAFTKRHSSLVVVSCDSSKCVVLGGDADSDVRRELERRLPEIAACYTGTSAQQVELDFAIDDHGAARGAAVSGAGDRSAEQCMQRVISSIRLADAR